MEGLNSVDWNKERRQTLETVLHESNQWIFCGSIKVSMYTLNEKVYHEAYIGANLSTAVYMVVEYCIYLHSNDKGLCHSRVWL